MIYRFALIFVFFFLSTLLAGGGEEPHDKKATALSYLDQFGKPLFLDGIGHSRLKITTDSEEAQQYFDQGLSLLHCFWEFEAMRAFRQVVQIDPEAAMGYWGLYRALRFEPGARDEEKRSMLEEAEKRLEGLSPQEQHYIRAEKLQLEGDRQGYVSEMEALIDRYPDDVEAQLFLALHLMRGYDSQGRPRQGQLYSQSILRNLLRTHPEHHAVHHYWIHVTESSSRPLDALESAEKIGRMAPRSGHIVHMAGHIFYQIGDYVKARQSFLDSMQADKAYMDRYGIEPVDTWNYIHNLDYLVANCAEEGRFEEGQRWAQQLQQLKLAQKHESHGHFQSQRGQSRMARGRFALAEFYLRFGRLELASKALKEVADSQSVLNEAAQQYREQLMQFVEAAQTLEDGKLEEAERLADALDAKLWRNSQIKAEEGRRGFAERSMLPVFSLELRGNLASRRGHHQEAIELLEEAVEKRRDAGEGEPPLYARPVEESLAEAHLRAGQWKEARQAYERVLQMRPRSGYALFGIARSWEEEGVQEEARQSYGRFLEAWSEADADLERVRHARQQVGK